MHATMMAIGGVMILLGLAFHFASMAQNSALLEEVNAKLAADEQIEAQIWTLTLTSRYRKLIKKHAENNARRRRVKVLLAVSAVFFFGGLALLFIGWKG